MIKKKLYILSITVLVSVFVNSMVFGLQVIENTEQPLVNYIVTIESRVGRMMGGRYDISINLEKNNFAGGTALPIDRFNFLIAYNKNAMRINSIEPGELLANSKVDYLTYYLEGVSPKDSSLTLARIECKLNNNIGFNFNTSTPNIIGELIKLNFQISSDLNYICQFSPIRFYWLGCNDNLLINKINNQQYYGTYVYDRIFEKFQNGDYAQTVDITDYNKFEFSGPKNECFFNDSNINTFGSTLYKNGGIHFDRTCCFEISSGDIDLQGRPNEIEDINLFIDYLLTDTSVFNIHPIGQYMMTEINNDFDTGTVADLVFLIRLYNKNHKWPWELNHTGHANFVLKNNIVSLDDSTKIGATLFVFTNEVKPELAENASHMTLTYSHRDGETRALVYSIDNDKYLTAGNILVLDKDTKLKSVDASDI
ncbi:MAG: hypothetical protein GY865_08410, partial [candidate division Zixibacteria bacterium]|nr:hypothetical protein [candidate division Zixibacteria bacterium]